MSVISELAASALLTWGQSPVEVSRRAFGVVYLATPYTKRAAPLGAFDWTEADRAARDAAGVLALLAAGGVTCVSPIVQAHAACRWLRDAEGELVAQGVALDGWFWARWCRPLLAASRFVYVPELAGWDQSDGIAHELRRAHIDAKPVLIEAARPLDLASSLWGAS